MDPLFKSSAWLTAALVLLSFAGCNASTGVVPTPIPNPAPNNPSPTAAPNEWVWVSGADTVNQAGIYGTVGIAAAGNVPGARAGASSWTDAQGNLWLFGGAGPMVGGGCNQFDPLCWAGTNAYYNDLWKFSGNEWTWMGGSNATNQPGSYGTLGVAAAGNAPGGRLSAVTWRDAAGSLWLFGGTGYDSAGNVGYLNDLWKWSGGAWTWMGGSKLANQGGTYGTQGKAAAGNIPGGRAGAVAATDASGNFWLFGGQGCATFCGAYMNDLWEFSGGEWTWVSGFSVYDPTQPGVYGTKGTPAAGNVPGGRSNAFGWMDSSGNLWIFGGVGWGDETVNVADLNDLWRFRSGMWAWMDGPDETMAEIDQVGVYGTLGTPAPGNAPGSRDSGMTWTDASGNFWLFGGEGFSSTYSGTSPYLNDLWKFSGGQWTWESGSNVGSRKGTYGTLGTAAAGNTPGGRVGAATWIDASGNLWLFGGNGGDSAGNPGDLNDLWEYEP